MLVLLCLTVTAFAQTGTIKGSIVDFTNKPLVGVDIIIKDIQKRYQTDIDGKFEFKKLQKGAYTLIFSHIGYKIKKMTIAIKYGEHKNIQVSLTENNYNLEEIVISAGRTSEKISEIPTSITIVGRKELEALTNSTTNINDILAFSVSGLAPSTGTYSNWGQTLRERQLLVMIDGIPQLPH